MKIYFTRHGETEWNSLNKISGATDISLSKKGIEQAKELAERIYSQNLGIEKIICSPMKRAVETASFTAEKLNLSIITDERLREWNYGDFEGKPRGTEGFLEAKLEFGCRMKDGGESVFDLVNRVYGAIDDYRIKYSGETLLLVCHGGVSRVMETYCHDMTREQFAHFFMGNCELRMLEL